MSIKRRQILRGSSPPPLYDGEFFQDTDTGDVIIGHNGGTVQVSNTGTLSTQITALQSGKLDASEVTSDASPNKIVRRDESGKIVGSITGNAVTADKLKNQFTVEFAGGATGTVSMDGSQNKTVSITVDPDEHVHSVIDLTGFPALSEADSGKVLKNVGGALAFASEELPDNTYTKTEVDDLVAQKAAASHNHNTLYYTEAEVDSLLTNKSNTGHTHDTRYYTETEIDNKLADKSPTGHTHAGYADSTHNHDGSYSATGHTHDSRYYTETEVDGKLAAKAGTEHDHDARYHTKAEIAAMLEPVELASEYASDASGSANAAAAYSSLAADYSSIATDKATIAIANANIATEQAEISTGLKNDIMSLQAAVGNIDGGNSLSVYTARQVINGGDSSG